MTLRTKDLPVWKRTATGWSLADGGEALAILYRLAPDARACLPPGCAFEILTREADGSLRFCGYGRACADAKRAAERELEHQRHNPTGGTRHAHH